MASQPHWRGWYEGLSDAFLALPAPKLLLLAGSDRLDKPLTIGQMQVRVCVGTRWRGRGWVRALMQVRR